MKTYSTLRASFALVTLAFIPPLVSAQQYPYKAIRWVVPYAAGGGSDATARVIAQAISKNVGQPVIIENKPGAGTQIGAQNIAMSAPDGYTIGTVDSGTLAYNPSLYKKLSYDVDRSFTYVGGLVRMPLVLVAKPDLAVTSLKDVIALASKTPGRLTYASAGNGSPHHIAMEMLEQQAGIKFLHVPYKGVAPGMQDVMAGLADMMMLDLAGGMSAVKSGRVKLIAVASPNRLAQLPSVPTLNEAGLPGFSAYAWQGLVAPAGTPPAIVQRLSTEVKKALDDREVRAKLSTIGIEPMLMTPKDFASYSKSEQARWAPIIKSAGITLD